MNKQSDLKQGDLKQGDLKQSNYKQGKPFSTPIPNCTLVTACYDLHKYNPKCRTTEECLELIDPLLKIPIYLVIYGSKTTIPAIRARRHKYAAITKYIQIELEDLWTYQFLDQVKQNRAKYWPTRDERTCAESHIICCNKFDFVLETISINPFNTTHFGWIDAYLGKGDTLRICENYTPTTVPYILRTIAEEWKSEKFHIQILNACDKRFKDPENKREYYNQYRWLICGGFFVTAPDSGIAILSRLKEIFVSTTQAGYGHGEEMFYLEVLDEYKDQIRGTYGDYGQILDNFIYPTRNIEYMYHTIMARYKEYGYEPEYEAAAAQLLEAANKSWVIIDDDTYNIIHHQISQLSEANQEKSSPV
jgi:hypothetical protein